MPDGGYGRYGCAVCLPIMPEFGNGHMVVLMGHVRTFLQTANFVCVAHKQSGFGRRKHGNDES
jgi:hypothetical protein